MQNPACARPSRRAILPALQIVPAPPVAAPALSAIAWVAKAHWGYPADCMEQWRAQLTITPQSIAENETFLADLNGQIVGFHVLVEAAESWRLEHLWIPEQMGGGLAGVSSPTRRPSCGTRSNLPNDRADQTPSHHRRIGAVRVGTIESEIDHTAANCHYWLRL